VKKVLVLFVVAFLLLPLFGCASQSQDGATATTPVVSGNNMQNGKETNQMVVERGDTVSVIYTGKFEDGEIFDSNVGEEPFTFVAGVGQVIPGFDNAVLGMKIGEEKTVTIPPDQGYGYRDDRLVFKYPISGFPDDIRNNLEVGMTLYMNTEQGPVPVKVIEIEGATVTLDANHPLADKTLVFDIKVVDIKKSDQ